MKTNKKWQFLLLLSTLVVGCSNVKKADISASANPNDEIARLDKDIALAKGEQLDVLAQDSFEKSNAHFATAKKYMGRDANQVDILNELRFSKGYLDDARSIANDKRKNVEPILLVRQKALDAGVNQFPLLSKEMKKIDNDTAKLAKNKNEKMDQEKIKDIQDEYSKLELLAITEKFLGNARAEIEAAKESKASSKAPSSLTKAQADFALASNKISANRNDSSLFQNEVDQANITSDRLTRVLKLTKEKGSKISEVAAIAIVTKEDENNSLGKKVSEKDQAIAALGTEAAKKDQELSAAQQDVTTAQSETADAQREVAMKKAMALAAKSFSASEATVYEQDQNLVIRLKTINFKSGRAELPTAAFTTLAKVEDVAKFLSAKEVVVQGHTDSIGSKNKNQKLSEARAASVAKYLEQNGMPGTIQAEGRGDLEPLTTNKTAEGRAENRRVDIVIKPASL